MFDANFYLLPKYLFHYEESRRIQNENAKNTVWNVVLNCVSNWNGWNAWNARCKKVVQALQRFRTLCCNVSNGVSQWKHLLLSHFLSHWTLIIKDQWDQKGAFSDAFLGFETRSGSGVSERFKRSETPVSLMVSQCIFGVDAKKWCHCVALIKYFVERYFSSVVAMFSFRKSHWKSLIMEDEPLLTKAFKRFRMFQK